ncbi:MAG: ECF transporter S component [Clostridia bacterium]|nr:ECF transporter S component [Clostridia bacterium]
MKATQNNSQRVKRITIIALFCAMSFIVSVILPIKVIFLTLDFKDAISTICGMFFGPVSGLVCALIVPFIEATYSGTGVYGLIMNIISSVTLVGISSTVYKYKKTIWGAVLGLVTAAVATMGIMTLANILITPYYLKITMGLSLEVAKETVNGLLPTTIIPFNIIKSILNASIAMLLYKPISRMLKNILRTKDDALKEGASLDSANDETKKRNKMRSVIVTVISGIIVVIAFVIVFLVLGGKLA